MWELQVHGCWVAMLSVVPTQALCGPVPPGVAEPSRGSPGALLGLVLLAPPAHLPVPFWSSSHARGSCPAGNGPVQSCSRRALWALLSTSHPGPLLALAPWAVLRAVALGVATGLSLGPPLPARQQNRAPTAASPRSERLGERVREQRRLPAPGFWEARLSSQPRKALGRASRPAAGAVHRLPADGSPQGQRSRPRLPPVTGTGGAGEGSLLTGSPSAPGLGSGPRGGRPMQDSRRGEAQLHCGARDGQEGTQTPAQRSQ